MSEAQNNEKWVIALTTTRIDDPARWEKIDDAVDKWHVLQQTEYTRIGSPSLHEYLGWTWEEYAAFVERCEMPTKREGAM